METNRPQGTQSLQRGLSILSLLGTHHAEGLRLTDISRLLGLEASTAHRLLSCLISEHYVERNPNNKRFHLGIASMQLALGATERLPLTERLRPIMQKVARISGDTVFLVARQGDFALCLHREHGDFPVHINTTVPGGSRPLGIGAGGTAIMSGLTNAEACAIYERQAPAYQAVGLTLDHLLESLEQTRRTGFSETVDVITKGISAIGMQIPLGSGSRPLAALSVGSISSRMGPERRKELGALLSDCLAELTL
ncbi:MAG: IclR family transcriptional regulator [Pseudomonas formosensis]|nr:IclR family transcriptional regulator [Halopseudomonas formosensis]